VGNPVRAELLQRGAAATYDYRASRPLRLLVVGGSLGALAINEVMPAALARVDAAVVVRHQSGPAHAEKLTGLYAEVPDVDVEVLSYIEDMGACYEWADLVLCRAGALTVAELAIMGRPSILVPLPNAIDNHQFHNAAWLAEQGAAILLPQDKMNPLSVAELLADLQREPQRLANMAAAAKAAATPGATGAVADVCEEVRRGV